MSKNQTTYTDEFRRDAVDLYINSGKPISEISAGLGIAPQTLRDWKRKFLGGSGGAASAAGTAGTGASAEELAGEIRKLHKELEHVSRQRDILKKAVAILGESPHPSSH